MREVAGDLTGKRILDIGCSRGMLLERFRRYEDVEFWAIELEPESREIASARGIEAEAHQINVYVGRELLARLPFPSESVDVVLAAEIIEHIVDTQGFVAEIARVLRPGGTVLFSTPNILWWKYRSTSCSGAIPTRSSTGFASARTSATCARSRRRCSASSPRRRGSRSCASRGSGSARSRR